MPLYPAVLKRLNDHVLLLRSILHYQHFFSILDTNKKKITFNKLTMKIAVIGAGGVGGYFGGRLAKAGYDVTFVARGAHLETLRTRGLTVKSILEDFHIAKIKATENITDIDKPDLIIPCTKAWQIKEIRKDIKKILHPESIILPLQNGISAADELAEEINTSHIIGGLCRIISKIEAPGIINHFAITPSIIFGDWV